MITQELLKKSLHYNPETGIFTRISGRHANKNVGHINSYGYVCIYVHDKIYKAHRLAFLYLTGLFPMCDVDHMDGNPANNAWHNLRDVETIINCQNRRVAQKNATTSGLLGISKQGNKFVARITINKITIYLGTFSSVEEAYQSYLNAKRKYHEGCTI